MLTGPQGEIISRCSASGRQNMENDTTGKGEDKLAESVLWLQRAAIARLLSEIITTPEREDLIRLGDEFQNRAEEAHEAASNALEK